MTGPPAPTAFAGSASPVFGKIVQDDLGSQENKIYASEDRISFQNLFSIPGARTGDVDPLRRMGRRRIILTLQRIRVVLSFLKSFQFVVPNSFEQRFYEGYICVAPGH